MSRKDYNKLLVSTNEIARNARAALGITQEQFALLLGTHHITVSRWERGKAVPSAFMAALMDKFAVAARRNKGIGRQAVEIYNLEGVAKATYHLLKAAFR